ncbi:MAG: cytoplasmic protein [bacterium]
MFEERTANFPDDIKKVHNHSSQHREEILSSTICGCFYCCKIFSPSEIDDWCDEDINDEGQTAHCPKCGIIGDKSGYEITKDFLAKMNKYWFN